MIVPQRLTSASPESAPVAESQRIHVPAGGRWLVAGKSTDLPPASLGTEAGPQVGPASNLVWRHAHVGRANRPTFERVDIDPVTRRQAVLDVIRTARARLRMSLFRCDDEAVLRAVADATRRGVVVEVLLTGRARRSQRANRYVRRWLELAGARVHESAEYPKYHAKFAIADDRTALISSGNFTRKCFTRTADFMLTTRDAAIVAGLQWLFARDREGLPGVPLADCRRLIVAPDNARTSFHALLRSARASIRLIDPKLRDGDAIALLARQAAAGVHVRAITGAHVGPLLAHGKLLVVDDRLAVIGSTALSPAALDRRRELSVIVPTPTDVAALAHFFDAAVASSPPPVTEDPYAIHVASRTASTAQPVAVPAALPPWRGEGSGLRAVCQR